MMTWTDTIRDWQTAARGAGRAAGTIRLRTHYLERFADQCPVGPWQVTPDHVSAWLDHDGWSAETRKSALSSLRGLYRWAVRTDRTQVDPTARVDSVHVPRAVPRPCAPSAWERALAGADDRERLMLLLARYAGLRRAEIAGLHSDDIGADALRVRGKGGVVRLVPIAPQLAGPLAAVGGGGWVFPTGGGEHLTADRVGRILSRLLGPGWTGHTLRHAFASRAYEGTHDLRGVQSVLGHASSATTDRYVAVADSAAVAAVLAASA